MQTCHSGVGKFVISRLRTKAPDIKTISLPFRDQEVLSVYYAQNSSFTCTLWIITLIALWPTLRQESMNFWSFLTRPGDKHDKKISNCIALRLPSWSNLMILTIFQIFPRQTSLPISWFCSEISFWNEMFLCSIKTECLLLLNHNWFSSCKRWELQAVQGRQQETSRRFCETLGGHMFFKCDEMS